MSERKKCICGSTEKRCPVHGVIAVEEGVGTPNPFKRYYGRADGVPTSSCSHANKETIPSYYDDTEWCPDCGAVRGNNGCMGPMFAWLDWQGKET